MHNRVSWKKGMRLSPEVFNAMDAASEDALRLVALLGSANRYGLFPAKSPFELSVNISGNVLEVTSLNCHGITRSGCIVDIVYDSNFVNTFDTRVTIPGGTDGEAYYLVVKIQDDQWREINETYSELVYSFELLGENSIIPDNCLPIGMLVNQFGWRLNETDFVPPCLYVTAHAKFSDQLERARTLAKEIASRCLSSQMCVAKTLLANVWNASLDVYSRLDKERDTLTPGQLYCAIQQLVASFLIGCFADEHLSLENQDPFAVYSLTPYDARNIYRDIETGLTLCAEISTKMTAVFSMTENPKPVEEKAAPKQASPRPAPEPKPGRNRWEGIEI